MSDFLRLVIIAGYSVVAVTALYLMHKFQWVPRRVISTGVLLTASLWAVFYLFAVPAIEGNPDMRKFVAFMSRVNHIPTIAVLAMILHIMAMVERRK